MHAVPDIALFSINTDFHRGFPHHSILTVRVYLSFGEQGQKDNWGGVGKNKSGKKSYQDIWERSPLDHSWRFDRLRPSSGRSADYI